MSEQKLSERMREVIDLYEEIGAIQDPIWVQFQDEVAALEAKLEVAINNLDLAWGIIANAGGGDWATQTAEWKDAAERWRDRVLPGLAAAQQEQGDE